MKIVVKVMVLLFSISVPALAADKEADNLFSYSLSDLMKIEIVTASRYSQKPLTVPASITVITSKEIKQKGYRTVLDILRDVPMIDIASPGQGYFTDIGGRGVNQRATMGKHWQVLIDGHDMAWTQFNRNHLSDAWVSIDNIERIEIVKGPASAVWGANAYLGVINIITKDADSIEHGQISFGIGNDKFYSISGTAAGKFGKKGELISTASIVHEDIPRKAKEWSDVKGEEVWLRGNDSEFVNWYTKVKYGDFFLNAMVSDDNSHHSISSFSIGATDSVFHISKYFVDAGLDHEFDNGANVKITLSYDRTEWGDDAQYEDNPFNGPLVEDNGNTGTRDHFIREMKGSDDIHGVSINASIPLNESLELLLGGEYENQNITRWHYPSVWNYYDLEKPEFNVYEWGIYSQLSYQPIEQINFVGGARYDYNEVYKEEISPRAALLVKPVDSLVWKFMFGQAYKEPSLHELYYFRANAVYGNPTVNPEKNDTYETQITYTHKDIFQASLSYFLIDMQDLIAYQTRNAALPLLGEDNFPVSQRPTGSRNYRQQMNSGHFRTHGVEAGIMYFPTDSIVFTVDGTYRDPVDRNDDNSTLEYVPRYRVSSSITYNAKNKYSFCLSGRYVGSQDATKYLFTEPGYPYNMTEDLTTESPSYFAASLSFTTREIVKNTDLLIKLENITDKEYYDPGRHILYHQPDFSIFVKLTSRF